MRKISSTVFVFLLVLYELGSACPFCNVDGPATRAFIFSVFGFVLLGGIFILIWSVAAGHYRDVEAPKHRILELDDSTDVRKERETSD